MQKIHLTLYHGIRCILIIMEDVKEMLTIGQLARLAGVNLQTVRYYERRKLLLPRKKKSSGYRLYDEPSLKRLLFIRRAKELGFTLDEIKGLLDLRLGSAESSDTCERVKAKTEEKLKSVKKKMEALASVEKILKELLDSCNRRIPTEECPILKAIEK